MNLLVSQAALALQQDSDPFQVVENFLQSSVLRVAGQLLLLLFVVFWLALIYWTYTDSGRRGMGMVSRILFSLVSVVFPYVGTLVYVIVRPPEYYEESRNREMEAAFLERELRESLPLCPNCRKPVEKDFLVCPNCNWELKKPCMNCERPLQMEWDTCPYCGTNQRTGKRISY